MLDFNIRLQIKFKETKTRILAIYFILIVF